jgi:hypothetical protein
MIAQSCEFIHKGARLQRAAFASNERATGAGRGGIHALQFHFQHR